MHHEGGFARWWTELVATVADYVPGGVTGLAVIVMMLAGAVIALLYWWPNRRRRSRRPTAAEPPSRHVPLEPEASDELPDRPAEESRSLADRYAADGRFAEAVRERLRAMVRSLVERGVIDNRPGWTITELAAAAGSARPATAAPLAEAARIFSDIWYGQRPATAAHDARMRELAARLGDLATVGEARS